MKNIDLTKHIIERVASRKKINGHKAEDFIRNKFKSMMSNKDSTIQNSKGKVYKVILGNEKIVYEYYSNRYTLITYVIKTEADRIENNLLNVIRYYEKKCNKGGR